VLPSVQRQVAAQPNEPSRDLASDPSSTSPVEPYNETMHNEDAIGTGNVVPSEGIEDADGIETIIALGRKARTCARVDESIPVGSSTPAGSRPTSRDAWLGLPDMGGAAESESSNALESASAPVRAVKSDPVPPEVQSDTGQTAAAVSQPEPPAAARKAGLNIFGPLNTSTAEKPMATSLSLSDTATAQMNPEGDDRTRQLSARVHGARERLAAARAAAAAAAAAAKIAAAKAAAEAEAASAVPQ